MTVGRKGGGGLVIEGAARDGTAPAGGGGAAPAGTPTITIKPVPAEHRRSEQSSGAGDPGPGGGGEFGEWLRPRGSRVRSAAGLVLLFSGLIVLGLLALTLGAVHVPAARVAAILAEPVLPGLAGLLAPEGWPDTHRDIIINIRLPRIVMSMLVGGALASAGAAFQGMFRNPMADPYIMGVSSGSALGAVAAIYAGMRLGLGGWAWVTPISFAGGLAAVFLTYAIARRERGLPVVTLLLSGVAVASFLGALVSLIVYLSADEMPPIVFWLLGSLANPRWSQAAMVFSLAVPGITALMILAKDLNGLLLGDEQAHHLGISVDLVKRLILVAGTLLTAGAVSVSGIIGFVGLIVPHGVRLIVGPDHRALIPAAAAGGAALVLLCDTAARLVIMPGELPVGILTAMAGGPFFLYLLRRHGSRGAWGGGT